MNRHPQSVPRDRTARFLAFALAGVLAAGCVSVNRLREAQDAFNQAATAENSLRFGSAQPLTGNGSETSANWSLARNGYASALLSLNKIEGKDQQSLRNDGLWGTTLSLKALCYWRLGQYAQALATADEAQQTAADQVYPRDRALLAALPGLIKTDQAYFKTLTNAPFADVEALLIGPNGAIPNLERARALADTNNSVQVFLIQSQLAAYRNYTEALDRLNGRATVPSDSPERANALAGLKELERLVRAQGEPSAAIQLVNYWAKLCGLTPL